MVTICLENWTGMDCPIPLQPEVCEGATLKELLIRLEIAEKYGYFSVLINGRAAPLNTVLQKDDRVVFIPLMSGG